MPGYREVFAALAATSVPYVPVASLEHLITMKLAVGRPRDLEDVAALQRLQAGL